MTITDTKPKAPVQRARVLDYIRRSGKVGATDHEIASGLGLVASSASTRRKELFDDGLVATNGATRLTPSNRSATVHVITSNGRELLKTKEYRAALRRASK